MFLSVIVEEEEGHESRNVDDLQRLVRAGHGFSPRNSRIECTYETCTYETYFKIYELPNGEVVNLCCLKQIHWWEFPMAAVRNKFVLLSC